jgi:hydroxymethylpyrimidine/phosphomethylpyrimidine kinase
MAVATLVTPNAPELEVLSGQAVQAPEDVEQAALSLASRTGTAILAKGGDLSGPRVTDLLVRKEHVIRWEDARIETKHTHGTGCTLASGIATALGRGAALEEAVSEARAFVRAALASAPGFGAGNGPMGHTTGANPFEAIHKKSH